jgi:outer membrane protein OmpA-like peptidoglycan-associated protein
LNIELKLEERMRQLVITVAALTLIGGGSTACATKKFVTGQVGQVSSKVDSLSKSLEDTQERTKRNEAKITEVDQKAQDARGAADQAQQAAMTADGKASGAADTARAATAKAEEVEKTTRKIIYEVVVSEDSGGFKFGAADLPDGAKAKIDELVGKVLADPKGAYFEIEGHTDNVGSPEVNQALGLARAEAVKKYLYEQYKIPLFRINVISYGEDKPAADNKTKEGRAENRRVVIRVLG